MIWYVLSYTCSTNKRKRGRETERGEGEREREKEERREKKEKEKETFSSVIYSLLFVEWADKKMKNKNNLVSKKLNIIIENEK